MPARRTARLSAAVGVPLLAAVAAAAVYLGTASAGDDAAAAREPSGVEASATASSTPVASAEPSPTAEPAPAWTPAPYAVDYPLYGSTEMVRFIESAIVAERAYFDIGWWTMGTTGRKAVNDAVREIVIQNPYALIDSAQVYVGPSGQATQLTPGYQYDLSTRVERREETLRAVTTALESLELDGLSKVAKVEAIHDYVARAATYDWDAAARIDAGEDAPESQEAYGILVTGTAVCGGYADAFNAIARAAGLDTVVVTGKVDRDGDTIRHAWNMVRIKGAWRVVDVTWDDLDVEPVPHDYLLLAQDDPLLDSRTADKTWMVDSRIADYAG
ncbi:transglutaminase domain-containing protein [Demequina sp. SYSU T00192]|uniref:Transglutaminase domain-containing protein n=1 Tax=Demequina litoralis TaxID=3051660 RepID=A0ABT8GBA9_9MICO|nr:transglutaminase domain-containing protein [Demequina sp. SYSU T00192]MDN4476418.1 transglutaminase domain-containing protein [Demequina sp. SYSU T00192]